MAQAAFPLRTPMIPAPAIAAAFDRIERERFWARGPEGAETWDSRVLTVELPALLQELGVASMVDAGCHRLGWIERVPLDGVRYVGVDVVPSIVEHCRRAFPEREFLLADVTRDALPPCDLILCRDVLVHLPHAEIPATLRNFARFGRWLLTTTFPGAPNADIEVGNWRPIDLERAPFCLPRPVWIGVEREDLDPPKCLALWDLSADLSAAGVVA